MANPYRQLVTPKGELLYPHFKKTECFNGQDTGKYSVTIKFSKEDTEKVTAALEAEWDKAYNSMEGIQGKTLKRGSEPNLASMREDKNGDIIFKAKASAEIKTKTGDILKRTVAVFDAKGKPTEAEVGHGSIGKLSVNLVPFYISSNNYGVTMRLNGVQVTELKEPGSYNDAASLGFGEEEGYTVAEDDVPQGFGTEDDGEEF